MSAKIGEHQGNQVKKKYIVQRLASDVSIGTIMLTNTIINTYTYIRKYYVKEIRQGKGY